MGSWVDIDPTSPFSLDNLPFGIASTPNKGNPHVVTAIGSYVVSIGMVLDAINKDEDKWGFDAAWMSLLPGIYDKGNLLSAVDQPTLGQFAILGRAVHNTVRSALRELLSANTSWGSILRDNPNCQAMAIVPQSQVRMYMPFSVANYTDFYAGYYHARTVGAMFRGEDKALQPNYLHLPVAYHGRASSVVVSGTPVHRPVGQILLEGDPTNPQASPATLPTQKLDLELELGCVVGFGTQLGERVPVGKANDYVFGYVLLNDWSARDIQKWEYVPLGPFNGKNFVTMVSPWVVAADALERFRVKPSVELGVEPQEYLRQKEERVFDIQLEVELTTADGITSTISRTNSKHLVWSFEQMIAHHTLGGCPLAAGDLLGSGTISGPGGPGEAGCLLEMTRDGKQPIEVKGEDGRAVQRMYLEDGDTVTIRGWAGPDGGRIGFGELVAKIEPAKWPL